MVTSDLYGHLCRGLMILSFQLLGLEGVKAGQKVKEKDPKSPGVTRSKERPVARCEGHSGLRWCWWKKS